MAKKKRKEEKAKAGAQPKAVREGSGRPSIPLWVPGVLFAVLTLVLFREFIFSNQMLYGGDTLGAGLAARDFLADALKESGTFPRWAPNILGGTPFIEALSGGDSLYPPSLILLLLMEQ